MFINKKNNKDLLNCLYCKKGYTLVEITNQNRNLCKLNYEIDPELYTKYYYFNFYKENNIFAIKMLYEPIEKRVICKKNGKTIFYFEWLFDLYGNDGYSERNFVINNDKAKYRTYGKLTEKHIKKLNFSRLEIYVDDNLINPEDFLCIDLYDTKYYGIYIVMAAHCYFIYNGEEKSDYYIKFRLFDNNYLSFVTYDNKYLSNHDSHGKSETINFSNSSSASPFCDEIKDPFQDRISCIDNINNCMYCESENVCQKCNYGFSLFNGECLPSIDFQNNLKYFSPDDGINYYICSSKIRGCEECSYNDFSFNKFHCTKCSTGLELSESFECIGDIKDNNTESIIQTNENTIYNNDENNSNISNISDNFEEYEENGSFILVSLALLLINFI